jgi:putative oxygen-independent coproporphyrinogen III oxidase
MDRIREQFAMAQDAEITMEVNPGTASAEKLRNFYTAGINRLSIGMQSAQAEELKNLGRIHDFEGFCQVYREAVEAGFTNINVDIMSGLPGQTLASYRDTLEKVLHLEPIPQHISAYSLIVEEGTPFAAMAERGELPLPEEETERAMYEETIEVLAKYGFHRYEISNYARDGYECRHNVGYWIRRDYLGFGIGAASLIDNVRFQNEKSLGAYLAHPLESREEEQTLFVLKPHIIDKGCRTDTESQVIPADPIAHIMSAFITIPGIVGNLIPMEPILCQHLYGLLIHGTLRLFLRQGQFSPLCHGRKRGSLLHDQAVGRDMLRYGF